MFIFFILKWRPRVEQISKFPSFSYTFLSFFFWLLMFLFFFLTFDFPHLKLFIFGFFWFLLQSFSMKVSSRPHVHFCYLIILCKLQTKEKSRKQCSDGAIDHGSRTGMWKSKVFDVSFLPGHFFIIWLLNRNKLILTFIFWFLFAHT